jgi:hypothetical protein
VTVGGEERATKQLIPGCKAFIVQAVRVLGGWLNIYGGWKMGIK